MDNPNPNGRSTAQPHLAPMDLMACVDLDCYPCCLVMG